MRHKIVFHPAATEDAKAAYGWYKERNDLVAKAFVDEIDRAISIIDEKPGLWPEYVISTRRYLLRKFPFSVVYRVKNKTIEVIAVAHGRRKPFYWKKRS